jgi:hypothetical protein
VQVGHLKAKFTGHFSTHIVPNLAARISRKMTSGESWKKINYRITTTAFSAQGEWQRETGRGSWNVQYGDSTISHKAGVFPDA